MGLESLPPRGNFALESFNVDPVINNKDLVQDRDGRFVVNSAGRTFVGTVQYQSVDYVVTIVRKESKFQNSIITAYSGKTNAASFNLGGMTIEKETALVFISSEELVGDDVYSYSVTYKIYVTNNWVNGINIGWNVAVMDTGFEYMPKGSTGVNPKELVRAMDRIYDLDDNGEPKTKDKDGKVIKPKYQASASPVLLDGHGGRLEKPADSDVKPVYLLFKPYPAVSFSGLQLQRGRVKPPNRGLPPTPQRQNGTGDTGTLAPAITSTTTTTTTTLP
jgi:hypothetical protein